MKYNRTTIKSAGIKTSDSKKQVLDKMQWKVTSTNLKEAEKIIAYLQDSEAYSLDPKNVTLMKKVIGEYHCIGFWFVTCVPHAKYAKLVFIDKQTFINQCTNFLYPSTVRDGEQKRDEGGKPCYRFKVEELRKQQIWSKGEEYTLDLQGMTFSAFCKKFRAEALRNNMGCYFETITAKKLGMLQIGEKDKLSHTHHTDLQDEKGLQYEVKLENGYITSQFWTALHAWKKDENEDE